MKECHEIKAIVQVLKTGRGDKNVIKNWSKGIQAELGKYEKVVEELEELEQKLRNKKQEKLWKKRRKGDLRSRNTQTYDNETPGDAPKLAKVLQTD